MISALFLLLVSQAPAVSPVRVWLGSAPSPTPGDRGRVYVQTSADGHLVVLHARPDGRVEVLFPEDPASDPFVPAGTYEIPGPAASGTDGHGMVVAALSPDPIWFDEFVHRSNWDAASLTGTGAGADPEALLTGIVQRMLGDGSFNYDLVTYTVVPRAVAIIDAVADGGADTVADEPQPQNVRVECSFVLLRHLRHRHRRAPAAQPAPATPAAIAVYSVHRPVAPVPLRVRPVAASTPRRRIPDRAVAAIRAVPLVARARPAAAQAAAATTRSRLLMRVVHAARSPSSALVPANEPARVWVAAPAPAPARGSLIAVPATAPAPVAAPEPRGVARAGPRTGAARAGLAEAAPAPARAGSVTGVGLGQVRTAGWRH